MLFVRRALSGERRLEAAQASAVVATAALGRRLGRRAQAAERRLRDWRVLGVARLLALAAMMALGLLAV